MSKILLLILAMASGVLAQECSMADINIETYDIKVVNGSDRPAIVNVRTPDLESEFTLASGSDEHVGGFKLGDWKVTVRRLAPDQVVTVAEDLNAQLLDHRDQMTRAEVSALVKQLRQVRRQIAAATEEEVGSCSGTFVWNKDDIHLRDTVTITFRGDAWKVTC